MEALHSNEASSVNESECEIPEDLSSDGVELNVPPKL
jgi:hypothetical protein